MKLSDIFRRLTGGTDANRLAAVRITMLVAALDGDVSRDEIAEFHRLVGGCDGYTREDIDKTLDETIRSAGYLMLLARVAAEEEVIDAFVLEAEKLMPMFDGFGPKGINEAVLLWNEMAAADGDFSEIERKAIGALKKMLSIRFEVQIKSVASMPVGGSFSM